MDTMSRRQVPRIIGLSTIGKANVPENALEEVNKLLRTVFGKYRPQKLKEGI